MTIKSKKNKKVAKSKTEDEKKQLALAEKQKAVTMIATMSKENTKFGGEWTGFHKSYKDTMAVVVKYQKFVDSTKVDLEKRRDEMLEHLRTVLPLLKSKLGQAANKYRMAYIITTNLEGIEGTSLSTIRRLIDRYEEKFGALFPSALTDKSKDVEMAEGTQNHIDILYDIFDKGKDELLALVEKIKESIEEDNFDRLVIKLNANKSKIQGFQLVVKEVAKA